jgi:hypothetical protein
MLAVALVFILIDFWIGCGLLAAGFFFADWKRTFGPGTWGLHFNLYYGLILGPIALFAAFFFSNFFGRKGWSLDPY